MKNKVSFFQRLVAPLRSKKGFVLPMAIIMMVIVFGLCNLIMTLSVINVTMSATAAKTLEYRNNLDKIAAEFIDSSPTERQVSDFAPYSCAIAADNSSLTVTNTEGKTVLTVVLSPEGSIIRYSYGE